MNIIGANEKKSTLIVAITWEEWDLCQRACGISYDRRSREPGASIDVKQISEAVDAYRELGAIRKTIVDTYKKWTKTIEAMDQILCSEKEK